ncbi:YqaE/Pmp3 family membrane protein [Caldalkalibacillus mannanilyticus]|uniref:YqaE/Pmp3 family membrane protein n=1 Tax=Caldalkalibacillus mannanilyticus TaxID=1418 RepID=UPI0004681562|nr:YqaE/Pmp3 family membrane protein [Caldalkalibacillus mannanilyticus]
MLYLLCLIPPVAVLLTGRPIQALLNFFLTLLFYLPGVIHAILVVNEHKADKRMKKQVKLMAKEQAKINN